MLLKSLEKLLFQIHSGESDVAISNQKKIIILMGIVGSIVAASLAIVGFSGPRHPFFIYANISLVVSVAVASVFFFFGRIRPNSFMVFFCILVTLECCSEMIYSAFHFSVYNMAIMLVNMAVMLVMVVALIMAYIPKLPFILSCVILCIYLISCVLSESPILYGFLPIFILLFAIVTFTGKIISVSFQKIKEQNELILKLHSEEKKTEADNGTPQDVPPLSEDSKEAYAYTKNLAYLIEQDKIDYDNLKSKLPQMTPSELEICRLILKGYKLGDMVVLLGKSSSNITCQRTNIRAKLNLEKQDNLREALAQIVRK